MLLNKKGYILYDGLMSIIILSTTMLFFNQLFIVNNKIKIASDTKIEIMNKMRYGIDNNYYQGIVDSVELAIEGTNYCGILQNEKICIEK